MTIDAIVAQHATVKEMEYMEAVERHGSATQAAFAMGANRRVVDRAIRRAEARAAKSGWVAPPDRDQGYDVTAAEEYAARVRLKIKAGAKKFVVTCAQNNTRVNKRFFDALKNYCDENDAILLIKPLHYQNISLFTKAKQYEKWWTSAVEPYLVASDIKLGKNLVLSSIPVQATAANPLEGLQILGGTAWQLVGHPQMCMEPVATPANRLPKRLYTTGAVTLKNYSHTKVGRKAEGHHVVGALVVEVEGDTPFIRQINAVSDGSFYDLDKLYTSKGSTTGHRALALTTGDEHIKFNLPAVRAATYDSDDSIANVLKPEYIVRHDVFDAYSISHHHEKDPLIQFKKHIHGDNCARTELEEVAEFINETTPEGSTSVLVDSNHHDHLQQWLNRADANKDHVNALLISELQLKQRVAIQEGEDPRPLPLYLRDKVTTSLKCLDRNEPFVLRGVDYSQHGDRGANGSRGSAKAMAKSTYKMVIGHSHSARISKGVYQTGTSTGRLDYEAGLSDHTNTHCVQYQNGKRTLIDIFDGKWRAA